MTHAIQTRHIPAITVHQDRDDEGRSCWYVAADDEAFAFFDSLKEAEYCARMTRGAQPDRV